jgi:hypothetical protein
MTDASRPPRKRLSRPVHWALDGLGAALVAIGAVGIVTPGLPTTVFWIGAVMCFLKTRPHAVRPLLRTPIVGPGHPLVPALAAVRRRTAPKPRFQTGLNHRSPPACGTPICPPP